MYHVRLKLVAAFISFMMLVVVARLAYMQILLGDYYRDKGRENQIRTDIVRAARGSIVARDGQVLAEDAPMLAVAVELRKLKALPVAEKWRWCCAVAELVSDTPQNVASRVNAVAGDVERVVERRKRNVLASGKDTPDRLARQAERIGKDERAWHYRKPKPIYEDLDYRTFARAAVAAADLPGLAVVQTMKRRYPPVKAGGRTVSGMAAHILGHMKAVGPEEFDLYRYEYAGSERKRAFREDIWGATGLERQYNADLRGLAGTRKVVVNVHGQEQLVVFDEPPVTGETIRLGLDPDLQLAAEDALAAFMDDPDPLARRAGAVVAMDVHTGEILVMASSPSFDPNTLSDDYERLTDKDGIGRFAPFYSRTVDGSYPLGSVFKIVTATAALETGAITTRTTFTCDGSMHYGTRSFGCLGTHGPVSLYRAIQVSCNIFFYNTGLKAGGNALSQWASAYGFGRRSGVDLPLENAGNLPLPRQAGVINLSIGQGELLVTPLQVCRMVAAVANRGKLLVPRLRVDAPAGNPEIVRFSSDTRDAKCQGLYDVVNVEGGTGYRPVKSDLITIAGKTGTAQCRPTNGISGDHAWFAGFAPFDDPEIAVSVIIEHGGHGGSVGGPVAKAVFEAYAKKRGAR